MALIKEEENPAGPDFAAAYWRVESVDLNTALRSAGVVVAGYADEDTRRAGKLPFARRGASATGAEFDRLFGTKALLPEGAGPYRAAYALLATLPEWHDAKGDDPAWDGLVAEAQGIVPEESEPCAPEGAVALPDGLDGTGV
jgi:hypothetical protein